MKAKPPEDWAPLVAEIANNRMTLVAVDEADATPARFAAAASWLATQGIDRVAYLASGIVGAEVLAAHAGEGATIDQLILISGGLTDAELAVLGEPPKAVRDGRGRHRRRGCRHQNGRVGSRKNGTSCSLWTATRAAWLS